MAGTLQQAVSEKVKRQDNLIKFIAAGDTFLSGRVVYQNGRVKEVLTKRPEYAFEDVAPLFHDADVVFCNLETALSDRGAPMEGRTTALISRPENVRLLKEAGLKVVSMANNHSMDFGSEAMLHTLELLDEYGIAHAGAGKTIGEARKPAIVKTRGISFAFLAYTTNSSIPRGFSAGLQSPGLAVLRISPYFPPPHTNQEDLKAMELDIREAKKQADVVVVSCHWGVYDGGTYTVTLHQQGIGKAAIRAGANIVLGHHQHAYQGVEVYRGKIICHGLGNFIFDTISTIHHPELVLFHCTLQKKKLRECWLQPLLQDSEAHPRILAPEDEKSIQILAHLQELSQELGVRLDIRQGRAYIPLDALRDKKE